jgi:hypothetical protein
MQATTQPPPPPPPLLLRHVTIDLHDDEEKLHRSVLALCNEAFGWGLEYDDAEVKRGFLFGCSAACMFAQRAQRGSD